MSALEKLEEQKKLPPSDHIPQQNDQLELVRKSNVLVESKIDFTANEAKFLEKLIAAHRDHYSVDKDYFFDARSLLVQFGIGEENYSKLIKMTDSIMSKVMSIKEGNKDRRINILYHCTYHEGEGRISTRFHPDLLPYVRNLKKLYTKYYLANVSKLSSFYSIKTYQLLKQYESIGERKCDIKEYREQIALSSKKYKQYGDLKKRVLLPAQKEIYSKTDIYFEFEEQKIGKKVIALLFSIFPNEKNIEKAMELEQSNCVETEEETLEGMCLIVATDHLDQMLDILVDDLKVHKRSAKSLLGRYDVKRIKRNIDWVKQQLGQGRDIPNLGGYTKKAIEEDYAVSVAKSKEEAEQFTYSRQKNSELVEDLMQALEQEMNQSVDEYIHNEANRVALDLYIDKFINSEDASLSSTLLGVKEKNLLLSKSNIREKLKVMQSSIPLMAAFRIFLRSEILLPTKMDLVVFAESRGIQLKKIIQDGGCQYVVT